MTNNHISVLLDQAVNGLNINPTGIYLDGTFGRGGHSRLILQHLAPQGRLIAIDRDPQAVAMAKQITDPRFTIIHGAFSQLTDYIQQRQLMGKIDGILLDLGVSSPQLDDPQRGFSFMRDGPLDMRMDTTRGQSAAEWLATADEQQISWVLKTFAEERFAKRIAKAIVAQNQLQPITTTKALAELISHALPFKERHKHPATRTFQAIRIFINSELDEVQQVLTASLSVLAPAGRLSVISFHSLEDRIVKQFMRRHSKAQALPPGLPLTQAQINAQLKAAGQGIALKLIAKLKPDAREIAENSRARSAVLRIAERVSLDE